MSEQSFRRRLEMKSGEYRALLARLAAPAPDGASKRLDPRYGFQVTDIPISIAHPEGGQARFLAYGRNLSARGASMLHGGFVHPGSRCHVVLRQREGSPIVVSGVVQHCRHAGGSCHEIGVQFDDTIDPASVPGVDITEDEEFTTPAPFQGMRGRVLIAESWGPAAALLEHDLTELGIDVGVVTTSGALFDALSQRANVELVIVALDHDDEHGAHAIKGAVQRAAGAPVIAIVDDADPATITRARGAGAEAVLVRPFPFEHLFAHVQVALGAAAPMREIHSAAGHVATMRPLIADYVHTMRRLGVDLERAVLDEDLATMVTLCRRVRGTATAYGFSDLTVAAIRVITAVERGDDRTSIARHARRLVSTAHALSGGVGRRRTPHSSAA